MERKSTSENAFNTLPEHEKDTLEELKLTNTEWMRYRLSGELPERASKLMQVRYERQMAGAKYAYTKKSPDISAPLNEKVKFNPDSLLQKLSYIEAFLKFGVKDIKSILDTAKKFHEHMKLNVNEVYANQPLFIEIKKKIDKILTLVKDKSFELEDQEQADLIEVVCYLEDYVGERNIARDLICNEIKQKKFSVASILLKNWLTSDLVVSIFYEQETNKYNGLNTQDASEILTMSQLLSPFVDHAKALIKIDGFQITSETNKLISWLAKGIKDHPSLAPELEKQNINLQKIADNYFLAVFENIDGIDEFKTSHHAACSILKNFRELYKPMGSVRITAPHQMRQFLKKVFDEKVVPFGVQRGQIDSVYSLIEDVCWVCKIDLKAVTENAIHS